MLTGAIVSSLQGIPRTTHDIDVVVDLKLEDAREFAGHFSSEDYYISDSSIVQAFETCGSFNLIEPKTGFKVDFWLLTEDPFDVMRFSRRRAIDYQGLLLSVSSPEDTILMKLKWAESMGGSEKQFGDALAVYEVQHAILENAYLDEWADELGVSHLLEKLRERARPL
jgi:hypothetical protein